MDDLIQDDDDDDHHHHIIYNNSKDALQTVNRKIGVKEHYL